MARPVATALVEGVAQKDYDYASLGGGIPVTLTGAATNGPILEWEWSIQPTDIAFNEGGVPAASGLLTGTHGDFTNGKSSVQNPAITLDVPGGYCFSLRARNADGWSQPELDRDGLHQAIAYIKTEHADVKQPGANEKRYQDNLNEGLQSLEDALGTLIRETGGPTVLSVVGVADGQFLQRSGTTIVGAAPSASDADAIHDNVSAEINAIASKGFMVDGDLFLIEDAGAGYAKKKITRATVFTVIEGESATYDKFAIPERASDPGAVADVGNLYTKDVAGTTELFYQDSAGTVRQLTPGGSTDADAIHDNVAGEIDAITEKAVPIAADVVIIEDSAAGNAKKKVQLGNIPATPGNVLTLAEQGSDPAAEADKGKLYTKENGGTGNTELYYRDDSGQITEITSDGAIFDSAALHGSVAGEIDALTEKVAPVSADLLVIEDSAAGLAKKKVQLTNLPGGGGGASATPEFIVVGAGGVIRRRTSSGTYESVTSGTANDLYFVWGSSSSDIYAGGVGVLLHSTDGGRTWTDITSTAGIGPSESIYQIHGNSRDAVYFAINNGASDGRLLKYDGSTWSDLYPVASADNIVLGVFAFDDNNVWMRQTRAGNDPTKNYNGVSWSEEDSGLEGGRIWASSPDNVYVSGDGGSSSLLVRKYNGTIWADDYSPAGNSNTETIHGVAADAIWVATELTSNGRVRIHKYDGSSWAQDYAGTTDSKRPGWLHAASREAVLTVCEDGYAYFYDGGSWLEETDAKTGTTNRLWGVWAEPTGLVRATPTATQLDALSDVLDEGANITITKTHTGERETLVIASSGSTDADAIHDNVAAEISAITEKVTPVGADLLVIEDSADSNNKKRVQISNLPGGGGGAALRQDAFTADDANFVGSQETFTLSASAEVNANFPAGYSIVSATVNGVIHDFSSDPGIRAYDMGASPAANTVRVGGLNDGDNVVITYGA